MSILLSELESLKLDSLDEDWVQAIHHSEFLEIVEFPPEYESAIESVSIRSIFRNIMKAIHNWLQSDDGDEDKSWAALSTKVQHQQLLTVLAYYIDYGTKNVHTKEYRNNALLASRVYYALLSIPGFKAYHIYHSQLFTHSLACLSYPREMCEKDSNYYNIKELTHEVNSVIKELRPYVQDLRAVVEKLHLKPTDMNFEEILSNLVDITGGAIVNKLNIDKIELTKISRVIYVMIDTLLQEPTGEPNAVAIRLLFKCLLPKLVAASVDCRNANNLVRASYVTYSGLILTRYGTAAVSGFSVLIQHLCYALDGLERAEVRAARVSLVVGLMSLLPRRAYRATVSWLLTLSGTAKVAHRHIAMEILANLLNNEPEKVTEQPTASQEPDHNETIPTSQTGPEPQDKTIASHETTTHLKTAPKSSTTAPTVTDAENGSETVNEQPGPMIEGEPDRTTTLEMEPLTLNDVIDDTCPDFVVEPNLNGKEEIGEAVTSVSKNDDKSEVLSSEAAEDIGDQNAAEAPLETAVTVEVTTTGADDDAMTTEDESSQELPAMIQDVEEAEEEVAGLLRARPHTIPHLAVLRALLQRCDDASGTLRARALAALAAALDSARPAVQRALQELNAGGEVPRLVALAARCVSDERALVRRAALLLLLKLLTTDEANLTDTNLGVLVSLCRDASVIVRSVAISAVGALAARWARPAALLALLQGPLLQLQDPETKIQEQVTTLVQQLLFERLQKYTPSGCDDLIPFMFLDAIVNQNMRRHLQKACAMLVKSGNCINHRVVDTLSTHLGALSDARDLHALVLLTSVAPHVDCPELAFLLHYYYRLTDELKSRDARLLPLTIELLSSWSCWIVDGQRAELRAHLIRALGAAQDGVDSCRIDCAALAAQLDPNNVQWADELMQIYTQGALSGGGAAEAVGAADMALVAAAPPDPRLLQLMLLHLQDPGDMDEESQGLMVAGLGRLCVRSSQTAAAAGPLLARCLAEPRPLAPRVNALLALTDICARYTCIVEPLLECVCKCLSPEAEPALRRAAAPALTKLLLAGYLRLNTPFYYRYCALLADEEADVREPAEYYVTCCLTSEAIFKHFVECVLHYNKPGTGSPPMSFDARQLIYDVMLQRMSLVQKLNLQCRLAREVLEHAANVCEEGDDLPPGLNDALLDTITLLCGIRMKLPRKTQGDPGDMEDLQERVTTNIVSHKMKRTVAEVLVPAVLRLYAHMRTRGGQLAAYLVRIATDLLKDYRQEIEELIENDEELVEKVRIFQETIGEEPSFGNTRNLVTSSTAHEPETPKSNKRRNYNKTPKASKASAKRTLRV